MPAQKVLDRTVGHPSFRCKQRLCLVQAEFQFEALLPDLFLALIGALDRASSSDSLEV
jgi:hypothetical protein